MESFEVAFEPGVATGITFVELDGVLNVASIEVGAALQAGLQSGCKLLAVNGEQVFGMDKRRVISMVEGKDHSRGPPSLHPRVLTFSGPLSVAISVKAAKGAHAEEKIATALAAKAAKEAAEEAAKEAAEHEKEKAKHQAMAMMMEEVEASHSITSAAGENEWALTHPGRTRAASTLFSTSPSKYLRSYDPLSPPPSLTLKTMAANHFPFAL